jgi:hypothetical protein
MDVSGGIPAAWMPAIHAGMTKISISFSVGERTIMNHFVAQIFKLFLVGVPSISTHR